MSNNVLGYLGDTEARVYDLRTGNLRFRKSRLGDRGFLRWKED